ncbi:MAG: response regulator [Rhodospirillaceae bacterium]|nr:response regulator [Rhodospirillaceae bacterium]
MSNSGNLPSGSLNILLVEDSSTSAMLVHSVLEGGDEVHGKFAITHCKTLAEAISFLKKEGFDLVLLDLTLPDSSGLETLSRVRTAAPDIAIVVLTATDDESIGLEALQIGAQDYLIKDETYPKLLKRSVSYAKERFLIEKSLRNARDKSDTANQAKSNFLASMSHEFRTPMNAILGFGQMLTYNKASPLDQTQQEYVDIILRSGEHLLDLINDTLDLAKIEAGIAEIILESLDIASLINECISLVSPLAKKRSITISIDASGAAPMQVLADGTRLKQVLINLFSNGIKYNNENGKLSITASQAGNDWVRVNVTDSGNGIAAENFEKIFVAFSRLESESSEIEGTGIGLAVTKELVERMGGKIGLESTVGKGSTFWIELPVCMTEPAQKKDGGKKSNSMDYSAVGYSLLYVEDSLANKMLIEKVISRVEGAKFIWAETAEEGIKIAQDKNPDIIIMDINLPGMNGIEALKILQSMEETKNIPVVALSANAMPHDIERGMKVGFVRYLTKPIDINMFLKAVDGALKTANWSN